MESFLPHPLVTKIALMANIMQFYGYLHECACLFKQLCTDSYAEWNRNLKAIGEVIMANADNRATIKFNLGFTKQMAEFLIKNHTYLYYQLDINLTTPEA